MSAADAATPNRPPGWLLLVDDDAVFAEAAARILRAAGYEVMVALDHRLALQTLEGHGPVDLMVADIVMPDRVNGLALGRMARLRRPGIKIIYLTGHDIPGIEDEALGPVLRKPIDSIQLVAEVERALAL